MNAKFIISAGVAALALSSNINAGEETHASRAISESGQASTHASASAAHSIVASGQVVSAAAAVPLSIGGAVLGSAGTASTAAARDSMRAPTAPIGTPLHVTDETVTVIPPNEALKKQRSLKGETI
ncbi:MAG: hypothetical protein PHT48_07220 [Dechloromonas sp.]|nr:hypothetical protein [Dechloromonas sp.]